MYGIIDESFIRPEKDPNRIEKKYNVEVQRKIVHVMAWIILLTFYISPYLFTLVNTYVYVPNADIYASEILYNMNVVSNLHNLPITYYAAIPVLFLVLMAALFVQIDAELFFNMWPDYYFPFKKTLSISLREEEKGESWHSCSYDFRICYGPCHFNLRSECF